MEKNRIEILDEDTAHFDLSFKLIVIGNSGVGKSCLTMRGTKNIYHDDSQTTVGFEFYSFNIKINEKTIKLQIWDTCGQEVYRSLITSFYRNSGLAIIVYSINNEKSFEDISLWIKELKSYSNPDVKIILIGNKADLEHERKIPQEKAEEFSKLNNISKFLETSAKSGLNTQSAFLEAGKLLYEDYLLYGSKRGSRNNSFETKSINSNSNINVEKASVKHQENKKSSCCKT